MIERLVQSGLRRPVLGALLVIATAGFGALSLRSLPADVFPDLSTPVFNLIVQDASMAPDELECAISIPLETALNGVPGVRRVRSECTLGVAQLTVEFEADADYWRARQLVAERVSQVSSSLPPTSEAPLISSVAARVNEVMELSMDADVGKCDLLTLRDVAEFDVGNRLAAIPGVASVERLGGHLKQFQVLLDPTRMVARGVTVEEVIHAATESNRNSAGGFVQRGETEWSVRAVGRVSSVDDLRRAFVGAKSGVPIVLGDVAEVREGGAVRRGIAHRAVGEVVSLRVIKQFGADTVALSDAVRPAVDQIAAALPDGVRIQVDYDQGSVVRESLRGLGKSILIGAALVVLVLGWLLGDLRAAGLVTLTIPLSIAISGLVLRVTGSGVNAMTLGGLAIAVGLLVDAGIIVCENVVHRLTEQRVTEQRANDAERGSIVERACLEMARPIAFATAIVIAVFGPLTVLSGIEGKLYRPLAFAVVGAVGASLLVSVQLLPGLSRWVLRPRDVSKPEDVATIRAVKSMYRPVLDFALRHAGAVWIAMILATVPALVLASYIGGDFLPVLDEGALLVNTAVNPDASLDLVDRLNHRVEDALRTFPEVKDVVRRTGRSEHTEDPMAHSYSDILVVLHDDAARRGDELVEAMRPSLASIPGISSSFTTPLGMRIDEGLAGTPADLSVKVFGADLDQLQVLSSNVRELVTGVPGIVDVRPQAVEGVPELRFTVDREACNRLGVEVGEVTSAISVLFVGKEVSEAWIGARHYDVVVRLADEAKRDLPTIRAMRIDTAHGMTVPLEEVARIEETSGPSTIRREAGSRKIAVDAAVQDRDLASAAADVRRVLDARLKLPPGYFYTLGGKVDGQARAQQSLIVAVIFAAVAVCALLYLALDSLAETLVILGTLPSAFVGGIVALWIAGGSWNVSSLVGLIGLFGIAVQNGLVLITQTKSLIAHGHPFELAIREASVSRVRPKLLTASTAILGLLPLVLFNFRGAELEKPLAIVMIGGLITSTLFTLVALPVFFEWVHRTMLRLGHAEVVE